jgi:hypothetical protein
MGRVRLSLEARFGVFRTTPGMVLIVLLVLLVAAASLFRRDVDAMTPSEVSFLLAGHSLAYDFDLRYTDEDRSRGRELGLPTESLAVRSRAPEDARFDLPLAYPLVMAPWVRVAPLRGPLVLNALLVCLAALVVAYRLGRLLGRDALALVAVCLFASVMYRNAFLVQPTSLLMALVALAFSLALRHEEPASHGIEEVYRPVESPVGGGGRNLVIGSLIGVAATIHPLFLLLVLPAAVAIPASRRRSNLLGLVVGLAVTLAAFVFARPEYFQSRLGALAGNVDSVSVGATTWNLLYFAAGRNTGLLLYSLPLLALFGLWQGGARRSVLALTAIAGMLAPVVLTPFNYYGGPAAVGNAWAFPWLALLLFLPTRPLPRGWLAATVLLAAPAMYPTWLAPDIEPVTANGVYRQTAGRFHRWLPLETTQKELPPLGQASGQRLWIRSSSLEAQVRGSNSWQLAGQGWTELQIATPTALQALHLQFGAAAEPDLELRGGDLGDTVLLPSGGIGFRVENLTRKALHPMWWSGQRHRNYVLQLRMPKASGAQTLTVTAIAEDVVKSEP